MITAIELTNFKGVGERQRMELSKLTLMFGANSAGKSTVLQAMLYLMELVEHGNANVHQTAIGGTVVDLGGFERLIHRHEMDRSMTIRVEFESRGSLNGFSRDIDGFLSDLDDSLRRLWIAVTVRWLPARSGAVVTGVAMGSIRAKRLARGKRTRVLGVELDHDDMFIEVSLANEELATHDQVSVCLFREDPLFFDMPDDLWAAIRLAQAPIDEFFAHLFIKGDDGHGAMPRWNEPVQLIPDAYEELPAELYPVQTMIEMLVCGPLRQLAQQLRETLYVGPLRAIPPRGFLSERGARSTRWADGLAAWDALLADRTSLVSSTNEWLKRLGAGCSIVAQTLEDPTASAEARAEQRGNAVVRRLLLDMGNGTQALACEVGAGISQVVPVVVAGLEPGRKRFVMIEQPELHVHPALQVGLGDLFIEASRDRQLLIETHSEHVILRLLRRIRETGEQALPTDAPAFTPEQLSVLYVENTPAGTVFRRLRVDEEGEFIDRWPKGFFAERMPEL